MNWKLFFTAFSMLFLAELGDKTQFAVFTLSAQYENDILSVFLGASAALVLVTFIGVFLGRIAAAYIPETILHTIAGTLFIVIGVIVLKSSLPEFLSKFFRW